MDILEKLPIMALCHRVGAAWGNVLEPDFGKDLLWSTWPNGGRVFSCGFGWLAGLSIYRYNWLGLVVTIHSIEFPYPASI
jgi:hypothetical protein